MESQARTEKKSTTTVAPEPVPQGMGRHLVHAGGDGRTIVHESVVAKIVGLAVQGVTGVHALAPFSAGESIIQLARQLSGAQNRDIGVHVEIGTIECAAEIRIVCDYGADIPAVCASIRESVTGRVAAMTGLKVRELDIQVVDLFFPEAEHAPSQRQLK